MKSFAILVLLGAVSAVKLQQKGLPTDDVHNYWYKPGFNSANYKESDGGPYVPYYMSNVSKKQWKTTDGGMVVGLEGRNAPYRDDSTAEPTSFVQTEAEGLPTQDVHANWYKPGYNAENYKASEGGPHVPYYMNDVSKKQWQTTDGKTSVVGLEGRNGGFRDDSTAEPTSLTQTGEQGLPFDDVHNHWYKPGFNKDNYKASDGGPYVPYYMSNVSKKQWMTTDGKTSVVGLEGRNGGYRDDSTAEPTSFVQTETEGLPFDDVHNYWYKPGFNKDNYKASDGGPYVPYYMSNVSKKQWMTTDGKTSVVGLEGRNGGYRDDSTAEPTS